MDAHSIADSLADLGWYKTLCDGFDHLGLDGPAVCAEAGIHAVVAEKRPVGSLTDALSIAFEIAIVKTGDPRIGLRMARHPLSSLGVLSHMLLASANAQGNMQYLARYLPLFWPMTTVEIETLADRSLIILGIKSGQRRIHAALFDFFASMMLAGFRVVTGKRAKVLKLHHPGEAPRDPQCWNDMFGDAVQFGASRCVIEVCASSMLQPIPTANPAILEISMRIAEQMERRTVGVTSDRIRKELIKWLEKGEPRRKEIAAQLGMSERSLCRRLAEEGTTFVNLLDALRREMAETYLQQGSFKPTEITFALGFSDPSNFYRACKRWFGQMPTTLR
jgi:AraC-like DNA-binding protein